LELLRLIGEHYAEGQILIFVEKQVLGDTLFKELYNAGYKVLVTHGGQDQEDRENTVQDFRNGVRNIMIATSVLARGLDVPTLNLVINFNCPNHMEDYVHRIGRTGRAGRKGTAYTFITPEEKHLADEIIRALENSQQKAPKELLKLREIYKRQVEEKEISKRKVDGFQGKNRGYNFSAEEKEKVH